MNNLHSLQKQKENNRKFPLFQKSDFAVCWETFFQDVRPGCYADQHLDDCTLNQAKGKLASMTGFWSAVWKACHKDISDSW